MTAPVYAHGECEACHTDGPVVECLTCGNGICRECQDLVGLHSDYRFCTIECEESQMDPNANLEEQRRLRTKMQAQFDAGANPNWMDVQRLLELNAALDDWIAKGGVLPKAWQHQPFEDMGR